jgi:hypothetical protein
VGSASLLIDARTAHYVSPDHFHGEPKRDRLRAVLSPLYPSPGDWRIRQRVVDNATMKTFCWLMIGKLKVSIGWTIVMTLIPGFAILGLLLLVTDWLWPREPRIYPDTYPKHL